MPARRLLVSTVTATAALASIAAGVSTASAGSADRTGPVTHKVSAAEQAATARLDIASIVKSAKPMPMPTAKGGAPSQSSLERGAEFKVGPVAPQSSATSVNGQLEVPGFGQVEVPTLCGVDQGVGSSPPRR